jgi:catechol 2,3-dioxygenase-like lactoylglutathione lyase family enzyme
LHGRERPHSLDAEAIVFDHIGIPVTNLQASKAFFLAALAPLNVDVVMEFPDALGLGSEGKPWFWLSAGSTGAALHIAFDASSRKQVDEFYRRALDAGGKDNGGPGLRPHYHANYYAAFVFDPDGNNIEAVCHASEG